MPKVRLVVAAAAVLLAAGCSSSSPSPTPTPEPTPSVAEASPAASTAPCPDGRYVVTALESSAGKGSGGNITADFTSGAFTLGSDGSQPVKLDLGPVKGELRFNGEITGTYTGDPSALQMTATGAHGDASIKGLGYTRTLSAASVSDQLIGKSATAQVTCDAAAGTAVVVLPNAKLTLTRA